MPLSWILRKCVGKSGRGFVFEFFRKWREQWTMLDAVMASLAAAMFVADLELTILKIILEMRKMY